MNFQFDDGLIHYFCPFPQRKFSNKALALVYCCKGLGISTTRFRNADFKNLHVLVIGR